MSLDQALLNQLYCRDPSRTAALFECSDEPLVVMLVNESRRVTYANDVARWAFGLPGDLSLDDVHLEAVDGGLVGDMFSRAMGFRGALQSVMRTLQAFEEEWTVAAARVTFEGKPTAALVIGRRSLCRRDLAAVNRHAQASPVPGCLLHRLGLAWIRPAPQASSL